MALIAWHKAFDVALYQPAFLTGWILLATIIFLALYNGRKKLSMVPLGTASSWLQWHIYLGFLSILTFALHVEWSIPNGILERILALFFIAVAGSGLIGLYLSRRFARALTRDTEEVVLERIPQFIADLRGQAEALVIESAVETNSSRISDYYTGQLSSFFAKPKNMHQHLLGSSRATFSLLTGLDNMKRYLDDREMAYAERLRQLVESKDKLDYAYALQTVLKVWLFVHIPATYGLILLALLHLLLVYSFGGAR
ncbi:MAG: hypothetical protein CFH00_00345 [Alphaproteobacteria bacterium MarineAlpha1_Bin1]|nr:MAG: hypothetical protein CFH00_00345 [Alphaproteobacteria bacterium MarineAlpha1_Bin1]